MELDNLNRAILLELQENARMSFAEIGRKVGLSAPAVAERVQKMEDAQIIARYQTVVDYSKLGYAFVVIMQFTAHSGMIHQFMKFIVTFNEIVECHRVTGSYCLYLKIVIRTPAHLENLINKFVEYGMPTSSVVLSSPITHSIVTQ